MKFIEYQKMARRTQNTKLTKTDKLYHALLGMCSEVGEIMLAVNVSERLKEIGDLCWFIAEFCDMMEFDMDSLHRGFYSALDVTDGEGIEYLASGVGIIHGIFQKLLDGGGGTVNHFAGGNEVGDLETQYVDFWHSFCCALFFL